MIIIVTTSITSFSCHPLHKPAGAIICLVSMVISRNNGIMRQNRGYYPVCIVRMIFVHDFVDTNESGFESMISLCLTYFALLLMSRMEITNGGKVVIRNLLF